MINSLLKNRLELIGDKKEATMIAESIFEYFGKLNLIRQSPKIL